MGYIVVCKENEKTKFVNSKLLYHKSILNYLKIDKINYECTDGYYNITKQNVDEVCNYNRNIYFNSNYIDGSEKS